jgi:NhaA family Na+:H+ antiporter
LFYTDGLSATSLGWAAAALTALVAMNRGGVARVSAYMLVGCALWLAVLKSGVHATLAGVALAFCIPLRVWPGADDDTDPPLRRLEADLHPPVAYAILPIFAFANAGVDLSGLSENMLGHGVTLGIALGLALGKPIGVLGACALAVALRIASLPAGASWLQMLGVGMLCGIGFTMSLFVGSLAYEHTELRAVVDERLGILFGSFASAVFGYGVLRRSGRS